MLREAASVILLRRGAGDGTAGSARGYQVLLVRRRRGASFMASANVFPGGGVEPSDPPGDLAVTAARELFEEAGILLGTPTSAANREALRRALAAGAPLPTLLADAGLTLDAGALRPWSHWITPSHEPRRFSARFFVAECPPDQDARCDDDETTEHVWVTPSEAVVRAGELALPPPQLHTLWQLMRLPSVDDVLATAAAHAATIAPILPRVAADPRGLCLLLPWDPAYATLGQGEALAVPPPAQAPWATGKSRFVLVDGAWRYDHAPVGAA
jgi:8-oxo-dGTP pyrophosphatase MutT (NUDIX family)